jgi:hypothetical protein
VTPQTVEAGRGPQRMIYAATPWGHKSAATWLDTPVEHIRDVRSHLLIKLALLDRAGTDATELLRRQKAILQPIASAIAKEQPERQGFDATLLAWRRATAAAALSFHDDITQLTTACGVGVVSSATFLGQPPAGLPPYPAVGRGGPRADGCLTLIQSRGPALLSDRGCSPGEGRLAGSALPCWHLPRMDAGRPIGARPWKGHCTTRWLFCWLLCGGNIFEKANYQSGRPDLNRRPLDPQSPPGRRQAWPDMAH